MRDDFEIRPLRAEDREQVRRLALETADCGRPLPTPYPDADTVADVLTRYYLEFEPDSSWVAESSGRVVGYLTGCLDTRRYRRVMALRVLPRCAAGAVRRGALRRPGLLAFLAGALRSLADGRPTRPLKEFPGHLHVNLAPEARGRGIGKELVARFLQQARAAGVPGVHLATRADNEGSRAFFESVGFRLTDKRTARLPTGSRWLARELCVYVLQLAVAVGAIVVPVAAAELTLAPDDRVLVLAPHPDDEVLGCAGIIAETVRRQLPLRIVFLTNGDDNEAAFMRYRRHPVVKSAAALAMGEVRRAEAVKAARALGVTDEAVEFLGYPDRGMTPIWTSHWGEEPAYRSRLTRAERVEYPDARRPGAPYRGEEVLSDLKSILVDFKPTKVFVSHAADHHPDHQALELFATVALWETGSRAAVFPYLIHFRRWPRPAGLHPELPLEPPSFFKGAIDWAGFPLDRGPRRLKLAALLKHVSQVRYSRAFLLAFVRANELFGSFPLVALEARAKTLSARPGEAEAAVPEEPLSGEERARFVGLEHKSARLAHGALRLSLRFSRKLPEGTHVSLYAFGYRPGRAFAKMPKIHVVISASGHRVHDQSRTLDASSVSVERDDREIAVRLPLALLGDPAYILTSSETRWLGTRLDWLAWRVLRLPGTAP